MNYDAITPGYRVTQLIRLRAFAERIAGKGITSGLALPDDDSLLLGEGRHMHMSIMYIDICAFSNRLSESVQEQQQIVNALALFFSEMVRVCADYGAEVEKNTGDGLLAWFKDGEGNPPENCSKRAVACALTMFDVNARAIAPLLREIGVDPFEFRASIDTGYVTIAKLGAARLFGGNVAVGTTANCASKLMRLAGSNELVIGESVRKNLPTAWHQWIEPIDESTGWIYRLSGEPYRAYKYIGRWIT